MKTIEGSFEDYTPTDLSIIGLPPGFQGKPPTKDSFPDRFNQNAKKTWENLFEPGFVLIEPNTNVANAWRLYIKHYISQCGLAGIDPFEIVNDTATNRSIISFLTAARRRITLLVDRIGVFPLLRVRSIKRECLNTPKGLIINVKATTFGVDDSVELVEYLLDNGFRKRPEFRYSLYISPNIQFEIQVLNASRITVSYSIELLTRVFTIKPLAKAEFDAYVNKNLWLPIVRTHRFSTYPRITLF